MPVLLALGSALVYGVGDYFGGRASRHQASVIVAALGQMVSLVLVFAAVTVNGAKVMGLQGYNYRQILAHYFNGVKVRRLYK